MHLYAYEWIAFSLHATQRASFMPKSELLAWLNGLLHLDYTRVEQCANGAGNACLFDRAREGAIEYSVSLVIDRLPERERAKGIESHMHTHWHEGQQRGRYGGSSACYVLLVTT